MTQYARLRLGIERSVAPDYSAVGTRRQVDFELTATAITEAIVSAATAGTTVDLGGLTTPSWLVITNLDATNYVMATVRVLKASKTFAADKLGFADANPDTITDDDSTFVSALHFEDGDYAVVTGAAQVGNIGTFLVQAAAAGTLTLASATSLTVDTDDAGTPTVKSVAELHIKIPAGLFAVIPAPLPGNDLVLTADTAACECEVYCYGV